MGDKSQEASAPEASVVDGGAGRAAPRRLLSRDLLADAQEVIIEHQGETYRLRCTSKGKLILTK